MKFEHTSVMPNEVQEYQDLKPGYTCVDCTLGGAGHGLRTMKAILPDGLLIGIDQDIDAIRNAKKILYPYKENVLICHDNFSRLPEILAANKIKGVNTILLDLGFSFHQLKNGQRGFSFNKNEPLDMRMDIRNDFTAEDLVNSFKENELADIFFKYGEERFSRKIARKIVEHRQTSPIKTSMALATIVADAIPKKAIYKQKIRPATRVLQAIRIVVNKELEHLETFMEKVPSMLLKGGRLCVISFHSLEDRIVKQYIRKFEQGCTCPREFPHCICGFVQQLKSVYRKPVIASDKEVAANPMARSAKLRVAQRV
ncbi:MAG: 16S rRNA (cytosine(1402)-N(4))-methyltransferase RsmH [Desulfobacteraceae bacterium]|nr:16S rRNA (cytosine(1402)-N(4))-methyltransferase RsmH [Desulfobacteraceae bacterium]